MAKTFPLSKSEEGIYISSLSGGDAYNLAHIVSLGKDITKEQVEAALNKAVEAHPYIFTVLSNNVEGMVVKSFKPEKIFLPYEEVKELNIVSEPYTLLDSPLYRFKLYKVKEDYVFYFDFYHLIMDGTSIKVFIDDFFLALEGKELVKEEHDANEYSLKEQEDLESPLYKECQDYYRS